MLRRLGSLIVAGIAVASLTAMVPSEERLHCAALLVPAGPGSEPGAVAATVEDLGCYPTYADALDAGSGGAIDVAPETEPGALSQQALDDATADTASSVVIGTEFTATSFAGSSKSYFASTTCSATVTWEVSYVTDAWNDDFESGRGFGGCDHNKKFAASNFGGSVLTCTPNCADYGALRNEVSSLRWKD